MTADLTLYHGTTEESAAALLGAGWVPGSGPLGGNCGQRRFLYLTNDPENALWYAQEKGGEVVLEVTVPRDALRVDPEDGAFDTVEEELARSHGLPGCVVATSPLLSSAFIRLGLMPAPEM